MKCKAMSLAKCQECGNRFKQNEVEAVAFPNMAPPEENAPGFITHLERMACPRCHTNNHYCYVVTSQHWQDIQDGKTVAMTEEEKRLSIRAAKWATNVWRDEGFTNVELRIID